MLFINTNRDLILKDISKFMGEVSECDIKFKNLSNFYHCILTNSEIEDTEFDDWLYLNLEFVGYEYNTEVVEGMNRITTKAINVTGNLATPAIVEITPSVDLIDMVLTINGEAITIKNLTASKKIILNSEDCTVTELGINKFGDVDLWQFPQLSAGANTITVNKSTCDITIKYKPRFI